MLLCLCLHVVLFYGISCSASILIGYSVIIQNTKFRIQRKICSLSLTEPVHFENAADLSKYLNKLGKDYTEYT